MTIIKAIFLDVGGVLMTNGWDHALRKRTADHFGIDYEEMNRRHQLIFDTFETGKLSFEEYLERVIFFEQREYTPKEVVTFILDSVRPFEDMMHYIKEIKQKYDLKVGVVSNEGREIAVDRIRRFDLASFVDFFIVSSFVHYRKPDPDIYKLATDVAQVPASQVAYIDDREMLIEVASRLGFQGIHHKSVESTRAALSMLLDRK